jgi:predicted nucleotidyltransferase
VTDALEAARDFVSRRYPDARVAFLGGSTATGTGTPTSDLDILVVLDEDGGDSFVETSAHQGWLVEAFVYRPSAAERWLEKGRGERRAVLDALAASGIPLTDNDETRAWAARSRAVLAAGPRAAEPEELEVRRYSLSAVVDDLEGAAAPEELFILQATAFREAAELALLVDRRWLGNGKWLVRNLRAGDDHGLVSWAAGERDPGELVTLCRQVLDAAGGYLQAGHLRRDRQPGQPGS